MRELPAPLRRYIWSVLLVAGVAVTVVVFTADGFPASAILPLVVLSLLAALSDLLPISYAEDIEATPITAFVLAFIVLLPPAGVVVAVLAATLPAEFAARKPWYKIAFNIAMRLITLSVLALWHPWLQLESAQLEPLSVIAALISAVAVYVVLLTALLSIAVGLDNRAPFRKILQTGWQSNFNDYSLLPYGLILGWLWQVNPAYFALGLVPLIALHNAFNVQGSLLEEKRATARLLAQQQEVQAATVALLARDDLGGKLDSLLHHLIAVLPAKGAYIVLWGEGGRADTVVTWGVPITNILDVNRPDIRQLSYAHQITQVPVGSASEPASVVLVPLAYEEDVVGGMFLLTDATPLTPGMRTLMETFGAQAALALAQSRLIDQLRSSQLQLVQSERLNAIGRLAAGVAHEFNNLLAGILGTAELALLLDDRKEHVDALQAVARVSQQGGSISRGLLAFARQLEPRRELANLQEAVVPVLNLYQREFTRARVNVVRKIEPTPPTVCDIGLLSQVVVNLIVNALDAMQADGGTLTVELCPEAGGIRLSVGDTGSGIPPSIRDKIFEPFATTKGHGSEKLHGGSGLGLAIVYGVVTDHSGQIKVESEVGAGTTMSVWLPIVAGERAPVQAPLAPLRESASLRAVVVDDEPMIAKAVHGMLAAAGHTAQWFSEPTVALRWMRENPVDVIFVDLSMPELDGIQLLEAAQRIHPNLYPVIITGQVDPKQLARAHALGVSTILEKPFSIREIRGAIQACQAQPTAASSQ